MPRTPDPNFPPTPRPEQPGSSALMAPSSAVLTAGLDGVCGARRCACPALAVQPPSSNVAASSPSFSRRIEPLQSNPSVQRIFRASPGANPCAREITLLRESPGSAGRRRQHRGDCRIAHGLPSRNKPIMFRRHRICSAFSSAGNHSVSPLPSIITCWHDQGADEGLTWCDSYRRCWQWQPCSGGVIGCSALPTPTPASGCRQLDAFSGGTTGS